MASMPMDQKQSSRSGGKPPVSAHPAFPAVVALWFAALLGLGSLILPVQLIERLVTATGIASLIPAAAPPLGFTARAAIALVATILGALIGVVAARRVAAIKASDDLDDDLLEDASEPRFARQPFNAEMDLEEDGIEPDAEDFDEIDEEPAPALTKRRRALAMEEEEGPSEFLVAAPLPGAAEETDYIDLDQPLDLDAESAVEEEDEATLENQSGRQEFVAAPAPISHEEAPVDEPEAVESEQMPEPLPFSPPSMMRQFDNSDAEGDSRPFDAPADQSDAAGDASEEDSGETESPEDTMPDKQIFNAAAPAVPVAFDEQTSESSAPVQQAETGEPVEPEADGGGLVQLVQKLGDTLEKHREWSAQRAAETPAPVPAPAPFAAPQEAAEESAPAPVPQVFEAAPPEDAAEAMAAYFNKPAESDPEHPSVPRPAPGEAYAPLSASMRLSDDVEDDEEEDADDLSEIAASFSLPLKQQSATPAPAPAPQTATPTPRPSFDIPPPSPSAPAEVAEFDEAEEPAGESVVEDEPGTQPAGYSRDAAYGSLSSINNPFKQNATDFVRIEEAEPAAEAPRPAVVFPHQEARQPKPQALAEASAAPAPQPRKSASNDDNERALREALMNLQRMSK
ncbi:hypothetical protein [Aurantiacibacter sp. MUD61]|uniref:hypothetical protein n=1 Tax=Aurantiacibacter sp. MUD61 TaxID=3009083 RepID=UPI0022F101AD|nr:hypothetical protein [Aurantiacibacter sp. MUD61]